MSGRYRAYAEYKDSMIEWVGSVPSDWVVSPLFGVANTESIKNDDGLETNVLSLSYGQIVKRDVEENHGLLPESFNTYQLVNAGDIVLRLTDLQNDKRSLRVGHAQEKGIITSAYLKLVAKQYCLNDRFFYNLLHSYDTTKVFYGMGGGLRQSMKFEDMRRLPLLVPSWDEQQKIANFLDYETAKIDTLIAKQQQLIALLKEKRQAVISHAVTKGLNPNAPLRDSGVEWLGQVPAHWVITRLKYMKSPEINAFVDGPFGSNLKSEHFVEDGEVYVIESNFATTGLIDVDKLKKITKIHFELIKRSSTKCGDIIIAKIGARYGSSSILPALDKDAVVSGNSLKLTVNSELLNIDFANELLKILKENDAMDDGVNVTAQPALSLGSLNNLTFLKVPLEEQQKIVTYISKIKEKFNALISNAERFIHLAQERRTALISAAVTGKIDVRDWQAPEPTAQPSRVGF